MSNTTPKENKAKTRLGLRALVLLLLAVTATVLFIIRPTSTIEVSINGVTIEAEVADSQAERQQGLSGRDFLPEGEGVLFKLEKNSEQGIWMRDMNFSIDIIWFDENKSVITVLNNISPETFPKVFYPEGDAKYILETNAGFAAENDVKIGDVAEF